MAIVIVPAPSAVVPTVDVDYPKQLDTLSALIHNLTPQIPLQDNGGSVEIIEGTMINIGGAFFHVDADTAVQGTLTTEEYVRLEVSAGGTSAVAYYESAIGTWNPAYQGFYTVGGDLVLPFRFDYSVGFDVFSINSLGRETQETP